MLKASLRLAQCTVTLWFDGDIRKLENEACPTDA